MDTTYTTRQGDQWDAIAKKVYGDEKYAGYLKLYDPTRDHHRLQGRSVSAKPAGVRNLRVRHLPGGQHPGMECRSLAADCRTRGRLPGKPAGVRNRAGNFDRRLEHRRRHQPGGQRG